MTDVFSVLLPCVLLTSLCDGVGWIARFEHCMHGVMKSGLSIGLQEAVALDVLLAGCSILSPSPFAEQEHTVAKTTDV